LLSVAAVCNSHLSELTFAANFCGLLSGPCCPATK